MRGRAVFLDRDGVIVIPHFRDGRSFAPRSLQDFHIYPDAHASLLRLKQAGFAVAVVTNQPDVGNRLMDKSVLSDMHDMLARELPIDAIRTCTHRQDEACPCRKPKPGMIIDAARELDIDLSRSFMVGDRKSDIDAARAAGCIPVFIDHGYSEPGPDERARRVRSIAEAADFILWSTTNEQDITCQASAI